MTQNVNEPPETPFYTLTALSKHEIVGPQVRNQIEDSGVVFFVLQSSPTSTTHSVEVKYLGGALVACTKSPVPLQK